MKKHTPSLKLLSRLLFAICLSGWLPVSNAATLTVITTSDSGAGSLRQAITDANATPGNCAIEFATTGTIILVTALPTITGSVTINGPGTNLLTISGNNSVPIFAVSAGTNRTTISGLTIENGVARNNLNGAAISNSGRLTLLNCAFVNNQNIGGWGGGGWGGAIFNSGELSLFNTTFSGNQAAGENGDNPSGGGGGGMGGGLFTQSGIVRISGCSFIGNSATGGNGGSQLYGGNAGQGGGINGGQIGTFLHWDGYPGGFGGGGGGGDSSQGNGGSGGFAGGGGGAGSCGVGGQGGVGGGAGGGKNGAYCYYGGGGGGAGLGGGIFVDGGTVTIVNCSFAGNQVTGGLGGYGAATGQGNNGNGIGTDFYNRNGNIQPKLTATTIGGGIVTASPPDAPYLTNSSVSVTATPMSGWTFLYWLGDATGNSATINLSMTRNKYIQAVFGTPLTGSGLLSLNPQSDLYPYGTTVKLTALPPLGTGFTSWNGSANGTDNPLNLVVTNPNQNVSYQLVPLNAGQFALTVIESGRGRVSRSPNANIYTNGQLVSLIPIPDGGQDFIDWSGDASGTNSPLVVTMNSSKTITANFTKRPSLRVGTPLEGLVEDGFRLTLLGGFGAQYQILSSTNLADWAVAGVVTNTYGTVQLTDGDATNFPAKYYRAVSGQP